MKRVMRDGAVFARNHRPFLEHAVEVAKEDPRGLVTFRSRREWIGAGKLLENGEEVPIYFAVVDEGSDIRFTARLRRVLLQPMSREEEAKPLLLRAPPATKEERLWGGEVAMLYAISSCVQLRDPFPISRLLKLSNGEPIAENYGYSYSLVRATDEIPVRGQMALDLPEPPARVQTIVNRIVRDTALVQRLKRLHDNRCQRCNLRLELPNGSGYSEGHHLQPLGRPHDGLDVAGNVLILCPNCHALLDLCAVPVEMATVRLHLEHRVREAFVAYHNGRQREESRQACSR